MTATGLTAAEEHADWLRRSPAAQALARHGIDWATVPRMPLTLVWMPDDLAADDVKIRPAVTLYEGTIEVDQFGGRIVRFAGVPPVFADTLRWDQDEYCGWAIPEPPTRDSPFTHA